MGTDVSTTTKSANAVKFREPGDFNPAVQEALSTLPEFAVLSPEEQIEVTEDVALTIRTKFALESVREAIAELAPQPAN